MRTKELAIRASVGAKAAQITVALLKEIIAAFGIGVTIGLIIILVGARVFLNSAGLFHPSGFTCLVLTIVIVAVITMGAVFIPALRAVRINLAKALRVD
jgi:ABC-type antimicrobial peptide transport system permease subunit